MPEKLGFIITSRSEPERLLRATIYSLLATTEHCPREVIVVDDGSESPVRFDHSEVRIIRNELSQGVSRSRRQGALAANGDLLVWLDAHLQFAPDWLDRMVAAAGSGALVCSEFWDYELRTCHCWGADFTWGCVRDYWKQRSPGFGLDHRTKPVMGGAVEVPLVIGACYMMQRCSYERTGGFSPLFRVWGVDDQDISVKAWLTGAGVKCAVGARVGHWTRTKFPYSVSFSNLEHNQIILLRTAFEPETVARMESCFAPLPEEVRSWLSQIDVSPLREILQSNRQLNDAEFFQRIGLNI